MKIENRDTKSNRMESGMVRIKDIADELGLSTATVSNVIHGKTKKISAETVKRVQNLLEERQYIPNMAAVWLAQNSSKIICVVIWDCEKYERRVLQDPFVVSMIDNLATEIENSGYFMMIKKTVDINEIVKYASMWNMTGLILIGFCEQDYLYLKSKMHIPFVVIDGFFETIIQYGNVGIDNFDGGYQVGSYLIKNGHRRILCVSDNDICMDHDRYMGVKKALKDHGLEENNAVLRLIPMTREERFLYYEKIKEEMKQYTSIFCASDAYAIEIMNYLIDQGCRIPEDISIVGFDDIPEATVVRPSLTTIKQDIATKAERALYLLNNLVKESDCEKNIILPVELIERGSVKRIE